MPPVPNACLDMSQTAPRMGCGVPRQDALSRLCVFVSVACVSAPGPGEVDRYHVKKCKKTVDFV